MKVCAHGHEVLPSPRRRQACYTCARAAERRAQWRKDYGTDSSWEGQRLSRLPPRRLRTLAKGYGRRELGRRYADRFGVGHASGRRMAERLFQDRSLTIAMADRWCAVLEVPFAVVFPELYLMRLPKDVEDAA